MSCREGKIKGVSNMSENEKSFLREITDSIKPVADLFTVIQIIVVAIPVIVTALIGLFSYISDILTINNPIINFIVENRTLLLLAVFIISLLLFVISMYNFLKERNFRFYRDKKQGPKFWKNTELLNKIKGERLLIVGRTNFSWFDNFDEKKEAYKKALENKCKIQFIIQQADVKNNNLDAATIKTIEKHIPQVIENYHKLYDYLDKNVKIKENINLSLTTIPVNNSMAARYKTEGSYDYFTYDIGQNIKNGLNPYLLFKNNTVIPEIKNELENIINNSTDILVFEKKQKQKDDIEKLFNDYSLSSKQRGNQNKKIIYHYFERKKYLENNEFYPPVSIQLLITNNCTAKCIMCEHHLINSKNELSEIEIKNVIDYIYDIGTRSIIISGGEPFSRSDCIEILEYAKTKGLNVGLFTNGIKRNSQSITLEEARDVKKYTDWVQLSIDSFNETTYKQIRNNDLNIVKESLENLEAAGVNLEVVFTIQKLNIDEAIDMVKTGKTAFGFKSKVRFKFAHGPDNNNNFLLTNDKMKLIEFLKFSENEVHFYSKYFKEMIDDKYFYIDDIIRGEPLYNTTNEFNKKDYICHAINYLCVIDAEGNLCPCCFLYDDNVGANSQIRNKYCIDTLRSNGVVAPLSENGNKLKKILSVEYNRFGNAKIPVDENACKYCTRHFYQNAFLNELDKIVTKYKDTSFSDFYSDIDSDFKIWF